MKQSKDLFVSQHYFDELYNHLKKCQEKRYEEVMAIVDDNLAKCQAFMRFGDEEFPALKKATRQAADFAQKSHRIFQVDLVRKCRMNLIRETWRALKRNRQLATRERQLQRGMLTNFRKQWVYGYFQRWRRANVLLRELGRKDSI